MARRRCAIALSVGVVLIALLTPPVSALRSGAVVYLAYEADGVARFERSVGPLAALGGGEAWLGEKDVSPACRAATVAAEDLRFYDHPGIDRVAITHALLRNARHGRVVWGGSTITQQVVKNLFLGREQTPLRKLRETLGALWLDRMLSKEQQLTWYLNVAEFGPRTYGLAAAAQRSYGKPAHALELAECIALLARLPDPVRSDRELARGPIPARIVLRWRGTLRALARAGSVSAGELAQAHAALARSSFRALTAFER
ncbi:MAG: transglycosylase domain-containing protein [Deltaproteobacteria bacterium]|nr:transglycosylase domain-containing protein [Deltaproteobacteria bacterium]